MKAPFSSFFRRFLTTFYENFQNCLWMFWSTHVKITNDQPRKAPASSRCLFHVRVLKDFVDRVRSNSQNRLMARLHDDIRTQRCGQKDACQYVLGPANWPGVFSKRIIHNDTIIRDNVFFSADVNDFWRRNIADIIYSFTRTDRTVYVYLKNSLEIDELIRMKMKMSFFMNINNTKPCLIQFWNFVGSMGGGEGYDSWMVENHNCIAMAGVSEAAEVRRAEVRSSRSQNEKVVAPPEVLVGHIENCGPWKM